jgi:hypothetical protein
MFDTFDHIFEHDGLDTSGRATLNRYRTFADLAGAVLNFIISVSFAISIITVAYSAILYILSGGNPEKTKKAWNAFLYSVIAGAISVGTLTLREVIIRAFGVEMRGITVGIPRF